MNKEKMIDMRDALFEEVYNIASKDKDVIFINADTPSFGLVKYTKDMPKQYINTGVSEQSMILVAAGLALSGKKVFIYSLIPFIAMRCYEFIKVNICSMNLPITIIGAGAGFSFGFDGPTHHAVCDIALMRTLPEISIYNPSDSNNAVDCVRKSYENKSPSYIRIDKGCFESLNRSSDDDGFSVLRTGSDVCLISTGIMTHTSLSAAKKLQEFNINASVIDLYRIKPINHKKLSEIMYDVGCIVTIEENSIIGGIGSLISEIISDDDIGEHVFLKRIALPDIQSFIYGDREFLHKQYHIDCDSIIKNIKQWCYKGVVDD